jgi:hypothetical protein
MTTLRVAVIAPEGAALRQDADATLAAIAGDSRLALTAVFDAPAPSKPALAFRLATGWEKPLARRRLRPHPILPNVWRGPLPDAAGAAPATFDVVVDLAGAAIPLSLWSASRLGVWSLSAFDSYAGFWSAYQRAPVSEAAIIVRAAPDDAGAEIAVGAYSPKFLASRNAGFLREKSARLLVRELVRAQRGERPAANRARARAAAPGLPDAVGYALGAAGALAGRVGEIALAKLGFRPGMWTLMLGEGDFFSFDPAHARAAASPDDSYWADPFLFHKEGQAYVFFEDYPYTSKKGRIGVARIVNGALEYLGVALETDYHLSFPYVFAHAGEIYMLPESHESGRLEIWRCADFPFGWELHATAMEGAAPADSVFFERDGAWWLFTSFADEAYGDNSSELYLFRANGPSLDGIEPHPLNPVVIDSRTARPGGRVFEQDGRLYRISQDNAYGRYGYGFNLMEITRIDREGYAERLVRRTAPDFAPGLIGCHHFDSANGVFVFDARRRIGGRARR